MKTVSILFARQDSIYKQMPGCDVWDIDRDARRCPDGNPAVAHPPCRLFGTMWHLAHNARPDEKQLAYFSIEYIRRNGGVLEHPKASKLWREMNLPEPFAGVDAYGGFTLAVEQLHWGHPAIKASRLYVCGVDPEKLPMIPIRGSAPTHSVNGGSDTYPGLTHAAREKTPPAFAEWLVELARRCTKPIYTFCEKNVDGKSATRNITPPAGRNASDPTNQTTEIPSTMSPKFENALTLGLAAFAAAMGITDLDAAPAAATGSVKETTKPAAAAKTKAPALTHEDIKPLAEKAVKEHKLAGAIKAYMAEVHDGARISEVDVKALPAIKAKIEALIKEAEESEV